MSPIIYEDGPHLLSRPFRKMTMMFMHSILQMKLFWWINWYCCRFHILSDFDEGKRSCRRKLERHNNRRRRKPHDSKEGAEKESQPIILADDLSGDGDAGKGMLQLHSNIPSLFLIQLDKWHYSWSSLKCLSPTFRVTGYTNSFFL